MTTLIFEGLDGAGKSTLINSFSEKSGTPILPKMGKLMSDSDAKIAVKGMQVSDIRMFYMEHSWQNMKELSIRKDPFLMDRWIAGMLATHVLRGGKMLEGTLQKYDWSPLRKFDCIFVRASQKVRTERMLKRGELSLTDSASLSNETEDIHMSMCQRFYKRVILLDTSDLNPAECLDELERILS